MSGTRPGTSGTAPRRRRWLPLVLVVAFVVMPIVEIYVLIQVGQVIGGRIAERMSRDGIRNAQQLAAAVEAEQADERDQRARKDLDDETERRQARLDHISSVFLV